MSKKYYYSICPETSRVFICREGQDGNIAETFAADKYESAADVAASICTLLNESIATKTAVNCMVAGVDAENNPDFFHIKVLCTQDQYDRKKHIEAAKDVTKEESHITPVLVYDDRSPVGRTLMRLFDWKDVVTIRLEEDE